MAMAPELGLAPGFSLDLRVPQEDGSPWVLRTPEPAARRPAAAQGRTLQQASRLEGIRWLAQGTIYPDVIESAGGKTGKAHGASPSRTPPGHSAWGTHF